MELTCAVKPFTPAPGERFDASRHTGARRIPTKDASADGTIASTIKAGFARADGSVVRVAEVEVHRLSG
jgi:molecular chaperone GrpE (heat shock protein)